jgi:UDP-glucuronate decarboxylase
MKNILVTGGAGFVGSNLCKYLLDKGDNVICLDNFFTGNKKNIDELLDNHNFELLRHDITDKIHLEIDQVYNLACPASPPAYQDTPIETMLTSTVGVVNMLNLANDHKARILQASTSEIYGDPIEHPQKESYWGHVNPIGLRSCYDEGKRAAECLFMDYHREKNVDIRIIRIFNTYGPNMDPQDGRVVSNFIMQALRNNPITIYGDGTQTRSFQYITDLIDGMYKMMNQDTFIGPVNIGNPNEFTIKELAEKVIQLTNSQSKIIYKNLPSDDPKQRQPDITLAKEKLGWSPKVQLEEGLKYTIDYFSKLIN